MKLLHSALTTAIEQLGRKDDTAKLIGIIEKMAIGLLPAAKDAVRPIGSTCETMKFGDGTRYYTELNQDDKDEPCECKPAQQPDDRRKLDISLETIGLILAHWIEFNKNGNGDDAFVIRPPSWPTIGVLKAWIVTLERARTAMKREYINREKLEYALMKHGFLDAMDRAEVDKAMDELLSEIEGEK